MNFRMSALLIPLAIAACASDTSFDPYTDYEELDSATILDAPSPTPGNFAPENRYIVERGEYILIHAPRNGVGLKRSRDLVHWTDYGVSTLGQAGWPWAQGRLTAAHVLDLRGEPAVNKYVMFFHGSSEEGVRERETHGHSSLALAWSDDLTHWQWPD